MHHDGLQTAHWGRRPALPADWLLGVPKVAHKEILCGKATAQAATRTFFPSLSLCNGRDLKRRMRPDQAGKVLPTWPGRQGSDWLTRLRMGGVDSATRLQELGRHVHEVPAAGSHYASFCLPPPYSSSSPPPSTSLLLLYHPSTHLPPLLRITNIVQTTRAEYTTGKHSCTFAWQLAVTATTL